MATKKPKLLIKTRPVARGVGFAVGAAAIKLTPLFGAGKKRTAFSATAPAEWHTAELPEDTDPAALWDLCHQLQGSREVEFAEPDLEQRWDAGAPVGGARDGGGEGGLYEAHSAGQAVPGGEAV